MKMEEYWNNRPIPVQKKEEWDSPKKQIEFIRHFIAYKVLALPYINGKCVLEVGCGTGYGAEYLSDYANKITAVDIWPGAIEYCSNHFNKENLEFLNYDGNYLPTNDESVDIVISFQVIEHISLHDLKLHLSEIKRVLKHDGIYLLSTPNARLRLWPFQKPWNKEHLREYRANGLRKLLKRYFNFVELEGLFAKPGLYERFKIRKSFIQVYFLPILRLMRYLPGKNFVKKVYAKFMYTDKKWKASIDKMDYITEKDFMILNSNIDRCIDLYAICKK